MARTCAIDKCTRPVAARGWCNTHYRRWYRNGDPLALTERHPRTFDEQFTQAGPDDCWEWTTMKSAGYGVFYLGMVDGKRTVVGAHRYAWERVNRPLRPGEVVMHLCDNPPCVNPAHLRAGSYSHAYPIDVESRTHGRQTGGDPA